MFGIRKAAYLLISAKLHLLTARLRYIICLDGAEHGDGCGAAGRQSAEPDGQPPPPPAPPLPHRAHQPADLGEFPTLMWD